MNNASHEDFGRRLAALRADFTALGTRAADAASALAAKLPPPSALLEELASARDAFTDLRDAMLEHAGTLALVLDGERLGTLRDLEPVLTAIGVAEERQVAVHAWEQARESALVVLDRVMALIHRDEMGFAPLGECQARARELHGTLSRSTPHDLEHETVMVSGKVRPFAELLALVDGWSVLDDDRCAYLQDVITDSFGRPLALAALRGKLGGEGELPPLEPRPRGRVAEPYLHPPPNYVPPAYPAAATAADDAGAPAGSEAPARGAALYPTAPPAYPSGVPVHPGAAYAPGAPAGGTPAGVGAPAGRAGDASGIPLAPGGTAITAGTPGVVGGAGGPAGGGVVVGGGAPVGSSLVVEIRLSGDRINVETPEARKEREELLERLAQDNAKWWTAARDGWRAMDARGVSFTDAAREYVQRFPTLLSVPLQKSAEAEGGRVAEGYALLLAHIERLEEGFVRQALTRLNPQFTIREKDESYPLGQELYLYVVAEGRLYKTYPDFVKDVIVHAIPDPGPWVQGGIVESDAETRVFTRGAEIGSAKEDAQSVTDWKERIGPHVFMVTTGPLTTRFFTLRLAGGVLAEPPDVEIKLKQNDAPTDHAWLVTLPMPGKVQPLAPRKHRTGGTTLKGLGTEFSGLWIGVFNADPSRERTYELAIALRRKPPADPPQPDSSAAAPSPAAGKFFGRRK